MVVGEHPRLTSDNLRPTTSESAAVQERERLAFSRMGGVEQHRAPTPWPFGAPLVAFGRPKIPAEGQVPRERALVVVDGCSRNRS